MKSLSKLPTSTATNLICTHLLTSSHRSKYLSRYLKSDLNQKSFFFSCLVNGWNGDLSLTNDTLNFSLLCSFNATRGGPFLANLHCNTPNQVLRARLQRSRRTLNSIQFVNKFYTKRSQLKVLSAKLVRVFMHKPFLTLEKSFLKSALPLSTPYRNLFTGVFDWDSKGFQEVTLNVKLLDLHHKIVRRKIFLNVLHKLTRKIRVLTKTPTYQFNYKSYSLFKEGGLIVNRYMRINPRQTSFLNNRSLRDQGWGTFLPCKVQILSAFFKTYKRLVTYDTKLSSQKVRFGGTPLFVVGVSKVLNKFDHFFTKLPQSSFKVTGAFGPNYYIQQTQNGQFYETYLDSPDLRTISRRFLNTNLRGFQKNLSFSQLRFRSSRQNRPQLKLSTKALWAHSKKYRHFNNFNPLEVFSDPYRIKPLTGKAVKGHARLRKTSSPLTLKRLFSNKSISRRWGASYLGNVGLGRASKSYPLHHLALYARYALHLTHLRQGTKSSLKPLLVRRLTSRKVKRFARSVQYKLKSLTGFKFGRNYLPLVRGLVLKNPHFSTVFRTFFWQQPLGLAHKKPCSTTITHSVSSLKCLLNTQPSRFLSKAALNLLINRLLRHFKLIMAYVRLGDFDDKRRNLINIRLDRARKYKRSRRKRRVTALSVFEAEAYLVDVRSINRFSTQAHLNALSSLMTTALYLSRITYNRRLPNPKVIKFALFNMKPSQYSISEWTKLERFRQLSLRVRRYRRSEKEMLVPSQLTFRRKVFLNELSNYVRPSIGLLSSYLHRAVTSPLSKNLIFCGQPTYVGLNLFTHQALTSSRVHLPIIYFNLPRVLSTIPFMAPSSTVKVSNFSSLLSQVAASTSLPSRSFKFLRPEIVSHYELPFIFSTVGFLFLSTNVAQVPLDHHYDRSMARARIHKHRLSFFIKNDIKRVYLKRPGLLKLLSSFIEDDSLTNMDLFFNTQWRLDQGNSRVPNTRLASQFFESSIEPGRYLNQFSTSLGDGSLAQPLSVKRIRFKPGYQRIWRRAREAINFTLNFNCRYQIGLTKRLMWLRRLKRSNALRLQEVTLQKTLLNAHFVFDLSSSLSLVQSNTVYVNGVNSKNPNLKLFVGDFIQLIVTLRYYIVYRWLINWNNYHNLRFRKLLNFKNNSSRSDLSKQVSRHLPDWIFTIGYKVLDIPKYLEVDYFTLSVFYIYEPLSLNDYHPLTHLDARPEIYTMYNWKYIT